MSQHDNTNKGALWSATAFGGNANVQGTSYFADLVPTNAKNDKAPAATLYLRSRDASYVVALFKPTREAKYVLNGKCPELGVNAFVYRSESDNPKAPKYNVSFLDMQDQRPANEQRRSSEPAEKFYDEPTTNNDVPF